MLSCIKYSVVLDTFTNGMLVAIPKKPGCDTSNPKNWRPIIIFTTLSKILELYILEESSVHIFGDSQFGFIAARSRYTVGHWCDKSLFYASNVLRVKPNVLRVKSSVLRVKPIVLPVKRKYYYILIMTMK